MSGGLEQTNNDFRKQFQTDRTEQRLSGFCSSLGPLSLTVCVCIPAARHSFTAAKCLYKASLFCLSRGIQEKNIPANLPCVSQIIMEGFFKFFLLIGV